MNAEEFFHDRGYYLATWDAEKGISVYGSRYHYGDYIIHRHGTEVWTAQITFDQDPDVIYSYGLGK